MGQKTIGIRSTPSIRFSFFGKESSGLSNEILEKHTHEIFKIPLYSPHVRSLNLANAVAITVYEGLRQLH